MAEELGLGFQEAVRVEMAEGRARPATRSKAFLALICCLLSVFTVAGLSTFLMVSQPGALGRDCMQRTFDRTRGNQGTKKPVLKQTPGPHLQNQFPALHWEHELGLAFTKNRMNYTNKFLVIPESGDYFIYSQITFRGITSRCSNINQERRPNRPDFIIVVITKVTDSYPEPSHLLTGTKSVCEISSNWFQPLYLGAMFSLEEGDRLMVNVSDISLVDYTKEDKTFFGAFLL
ncbi:Tumor necrosis factor ligand superfamily member 15 [Microtus ochrogaster]|uniref:Tumor necrosis factor ligand superfamily member 15 n=1 Tax=Microtus ochrogaster TaxID=79684 RepID=A0A8J6KUG5_MICOH|nr:Tumor necrosis factor ligand superfamily member 15 [Microtus ochrogaster]